MRIIGLILTVLAAAPLAFGQPASVPVILAFPQIALGGDPAGLNYLTLAQMVNNNSAPTTGHIALYTDTGSPLSARFDGQPAQSTIDIALASGEARQIQITLDGDVTAGWMQITYSPSDALTTVILQFRSGQALLSEVGVNAAQYISIFGTISSTSLISASDFPAETDAALNTGIALANPFNAPTYVSIGLWDPAGGSQIAGTVITLPTGGHMAKFLTELFPNVSNISQTRAKVSLDSCRSASVCNLSGNSFIATAIRLNGDQFTTIPIVEAEDGDKIRVFPQVAFGGPANGVNMKTVLYLTTTVTTGVFGTIEIFDNNGNPLPASADGAAAAASIPFTISGNRVARIVLSGDANLRSGWIRMTNGSGPVNLVANAIFQTFNGSNLVSEASVLESPAITQGLIYIKTRSGSSNVGVAFTNPSADPITITLDLFAHDGYLAVSRDISLAGNGHLAQFVTEIFPELAGAAEFDGALSIHSPSSFSALALRLNGDKIASLPVAVNAMYRPAIIDLQITRTQRSPAQISFSIAVQDFNSDIATSGSTSVNVSAYVDFGPSVGYDGAAITIDGSSIVGRDMGTLTGTLQPPRVTGTVPSGTPAIFYVVILDAAGNISNVIGLPFKF